MSFKKYKYFILESNLDKRLYDSDESYDTILDLLNSKFYSIENEIKFYLKSFNAKNRIKDLISLGNCLAGIWKWNNLKADEVLNVYDDIDEPFIGTFHDLPMNLQELVKTANIIILDNSDQIKELFDDNNSFYNWIKFFKEEIDNI